jgi:hypothetical protein
MTEYVVDRERYMTRMPPDMREIAVLAEPLTMTLTFSGGAGRRQLGRSSPAATRHSRHQI